MRRKTVTYREMNYILQEDGKVFSAYSGLEIKQRLNQDGYLVFTVGKKGNRLSVRTHRAIAEAFVPNPFNLPEVDHLDCNRANPCASNLEWVTHQENVSRSVKSGNRVNKQLGENNSKARLSEADVIEIRRLYDNNILTQAKIARKYNVGWSTIHNIVFRFTWTHI